MTERPTGPSGEFARGASTLLEILAQARAAGFDASFDADSPATIRCSACGESSRADRLDVAGVHRLEGASDAADELLVARATCPSCGADGTLILSYGPSAGVDDQGVAGQLDLSTVEGTP